MGLTQDQGGSSLKFRFGLILFFAALGLSFGSAFAGAEAPSARLASLMRASLSAVIPEASLAIPSLEQTCSSPPLSMFERFDRVRLIEDRPNGSALFEVTGRTSAGLEKIELVQTPYSAWKKVLVPTRRIYPNTRLQEADFRITEMNVATGAIREYRGALLSAEAPLARLQTKQTLLEGRFVTTASVERQPDVRRGDTVRLDLVSGDLSLSTQATASENGSVGDRIRVMAPKTKKEVVGIVREDHSVEVAL